MIGGRRLMGLVSLSLAVTATAAARAGDAAVPAAKSVVWYSGIEVTENAWFGYSGALVSANRNLALPGITFNGFVGVGNYSYDAIGAPGGEVDVDLLTGHLLVGYTGIFDNLWLGLYGGVDVQRHDLNFNDAFNSVSGTDVGGKVVGELITVGASNVYFDAFVSYSTAFDSYFTRLQIGPNVHGVKFGPEAALLGDGEWNGKRIGGFMKLPINLGPGLDSGTLSFSAGYQFSDEGRESSEGAYGALQVKFLH